ncbi:P-loop containing nucleoside triphosphate hydrolase protein [Russula compacta]|nr:P-loop containing nucleoside triphosphate hydrolase protein [Russula compacta]
MKTSQTLPPAPPTITLNDSDSLPTSSSSSPQMITSLDHLEASTTTTQVDPGPEMVVGGADTHHARKQLRLLNTFRDIGLDSDLDLPEIGVIGSQSSGKSSALQAISGVSLPRAPGDACTRCPIECRLTHGDEQWECRVFLRRSGGRSSFGQSKEPFGDPITDKDFVEDLVLRAQLAILNPSIPAESFLDRNANLSAPTELSFSPDIVCLEITGPEYSDISFVDLPGLIRTVGTSGDRANIQLIENLATRYISKENCIILVTITCETDFANQGAYELARTHDLHGRRTVGVLTKPDRSPEAAHAKWVRFINGETESLRHGWFCVKLHDTQSGHPQPTLVQAREQEAQWFNKTSIWHGLPRHARDRLGTKRLVQSLEVILSDLIHSRIPDIEQQILVLREGTVHELERLGKPPSSDSIGEINSLVDQLVSDIEGGIERRARQQGNLLYLIEDEAVRFKNELRATCPEFRAWSKNIKEPSSITPLPELLLEDGEPRPRPRNRGVIYLDDVLEKKTRSSARGLPDGGQNEVAEEYLRSFTAKWVAPTNQFIKRATNLLKDFIQKAIDARCTHFTHGGLHTHLRATIEGHLSDCLMRTETAAKLLLKLEQSGHTRNERYYRECKDKFLSHLKMQRDLASKNPVLQNLSQMASGSDTAPLPSFVTSINTAKAALGKAGFHLVDDLQLAKLLPPQATDSALEDMAKACAGFEVALQRFVDYVPLVVDTELVRGVCQELTATLRQSFRFSEPDAAERCREFLREPFEVQQEREHLRQKFNRLSQAAEELNDFWGP